MARVECAAQARWPQITSLDVRYPGESAYVDVNVEARLRDGAAQPLIRLPVRAPRQPRWTTILTDEPILG